MEEQMITDKMRQARKEIYETLTKDMTKEELKELKKEAQAMKKELGWDTETKEDKQ